MKEYTVPFSKRMMILTVMGWPLLMYGGVALGLFMPFAVWLLWGDWRVVQVNGDKIQFRSSWFGRWCEVAWCDVTRADWVGYDTAAIRVADARQYVVRFGGLSDADRREVAGWLHYHCPHGLRCSPSSGDSLVAQ